MADEKPMGNLGIPTGERCGRCDAVMTVHRSSWGEFVACPDFLAHMAQVKLGD